MSTEPERPRPRSIGGELIIPMLGLAFTAYYASTIIDSPWTAQVNAVIVGSALVLAILALFLRLGLEARRHGVRLSFDGLLSPLALLPKRAAFAALTLAYLILIEWGGFTLTTFAFLALSMLLLGGRRRLKASLAAAAVMALIGYLVFIVLFETRLPKGPFEQLFAAVL